MVARISNGINEELVVILQYLFMGVMAVVIIILLAYMSTAFLILKSITLESLEEVPHGEKFKYILILGARIKNASKPGYQLENRLNKLDINVLQPGGKIIVSGGKRSGTSTSEAEVMEKYLVNKGISQDVIICETKAKSTYENLVYSKKIFGKNKVLIITSDFHVHRTYLFAKELGIHFLILRTKTQHIRRNIFRETFSYLKMYWYKLIT